VFGDREEGEVSVEEGVWVGTVGERRGGGWGGDERKEAMRRDY